MYYMRILLLVFLLSFQAVKATWIEFKNFDPVIEEILFRDIQKMSRGIVRWQRDFDYGFDEGISYNGGISISYTNHPSCYTTRRTGSINLDNERVIIQQIKINPTCISNHDEINRIYALKNSVYHEVFCHGLVGNNGNEKDHTTWGLCRPTLSTDKLYWGKRHRKLLKSRLFTVFKFPLLR